MHCFRRPSHTSRRLLLVLLAGIVLMVQSLGLLHGIVHAGAGRAAPRAGAVIAAPALGAFASGLETLFAPDQPNHPSAHHSCLAFDALSAPAVLHTPQFALAVLEMRHCPAARLAFSSWHAPFHQHFSSRAPPRN
ncbi:MAG: hypothetical protein ACRYGK_13800 [Janthinobacterium lividum]